MTPTTAASRAPRAAEIRLNHRRYSGNHDEQQCERQAVPSASGFGGLYRFRGLFSAASTKPRERRDPRPYREHDGASSRASSGLKIAQTIVMRGYIIALAATIPAASSGVIPSSWACRANTTVVAVEE